MPEKPLAKIRIHSLRELDALVGEHLTLEVPEVYWEDAHAVFRFETEQEAVEAIKRLKAQMNLPKVNWEEMSINQIKSYRPYSSEIATTWGIVEKISAPDKTLHLRRNHGLWHASFGNDTDSVARSAPVAICVAGLRSVGVEVIFDPDRIH